MREADVQEWIKTAEDDLLWAKVSFQAGMFGRACFACQQAAEKIIKAFLLAKTSAYPRVHMLLDLLALAVVEDASLVEIKSACDILDKYYIATRYPPLDVAEDFDADKAEKAMDLATAVVESIRARLAKGAP